MAAQFVFSGLEAPEAASDPRRPGKPALGGLHPPVGSVEKATDVFEQWANEAAWMGFNGLNVTDPGSWDNLVELLVRGLHKRVDWADYEAPSWTLGRVCLERGKRTLVKIRYGAAFKYGKDVRCEEKSGSSTVEKARKVIGDTVLETANAVGASKPTFAMQG